MLTLYKKNKRIGKLCLTIYNWLCKLERDPARIFSFSRHLHPIRNSSRTEIECCFLLLSEEIFLLIVSIIRLHLCSF